MLVLRLRLQELLIGLGFLNLLLNGWWLRLLLLRHDGPIGGPAASRLLDLEVGNAVPDVLPDETLGRLERRQFRLLIDPHLELDVV